MDELDERKKRIWYVLHVKPRTEKKAFDWLKRMNAFRYLPLWKKTTRVQRRKVTRELPLFPGYVFTRLNADERLQMLGSHLVVQMILVPQPRQMIHQLRQIAHAGKLPGDLHPVEEFQTGEFVRVKAGPFMGIEGYVRRKGKAASIVIKLDILGQAVETSIDPCDLEKVSV